MSLHLEIPLPSNVATDFSQLIPINTTLKISTHGTYGSTTIYVCTHTLYVHTIIEAVYVSISVDAALKI